MRIILFLSLIFLATACVTTPNAELIGPQQIQVVPVPVESPMPPSVESPPSPIVDGGGESEVISGQQISLAQDYSQLGFPKILASMSIDPSSDAMLNAGSITVTIPKGAFLEPVNFTILGGWPETFEPKTMIGEEPIFYFAFKATDSMTGKLIDKFEMPVRIEITNPMILPDSRYYDMGPDGKLVLNPIPPEIVVGTDGANTLTHSASGASVGWVVTMPYFASTTSIPMKYVPEPGMAIPWDDWYESVIKSTAITLESDTDKIITYYNTIYYIQLDDAKKIVLDDGTYYYIISVRKQWAIDMLGYGWLDHLGIDLTYSNNP